MLFLWLQCNTQKLLEIRFAVDSKCCGFRSEVFCRLRLQVCSIPEPKSVSICDSVPLAPAMIKTLFLRLSSAPAPAKKTWLQLAPAPQ